MKRALLTGAHGFLGNYIYQVLKLYYDVDTLGLNQQNTFITNLGTETPVLTEPYQLVVHAAAHVHNKLNENDDLMYAVNRDGTKRICEALGKLNTRPRHFIFISTVAVYGVQQGENINEMHPLNGHSAYAKSKMQAEKIVEEWCTNNGVFCTILRLPLIVGLNAPGNICSMVNAIKNKRYFIIGKGQARKSMVLAQDVANLIATLKPVNGIFNLTDGVHPSFFEFTSVIAKQLNQKMPPTFPLWLCSMLAKTGDLLGRRFPFNSRVLRQLTTSVTFDDLPARNLLGWMPHSVLKNTEII